MVHVALNGGQARQILSLLAAQTIQAACDTVRGDAAVYDSIVQQLNAFPHVYASEHAQLSKECSVLGLSHPALFQVFKPVATTGDGSCLFHALSLTLTGTETCSDLLRLLVVHALVKYKKHHAECSS